VHVSTVSRVINSSGDVAVRPETRQRIVDVARELQHRPNAIARGLKLATARTLGLLVPSLRDPVNYSRRVRPRLGTRLRARRSTRCSSRSAIRPHATS
jgi:DNA-binding LacI/PurR family transcriptional regulator